MTYKSGEIYEGQWENDVREGNGNIHKIDGSIVPEYFINDY